MMKVKISQPCKKPLSKVSGESNVYDCSQCSKKIVDLSDKTDKDLADFLKNNPKGCAIFRKEQLNRNLQVDNWQDKVVEAYLSAKLSPNKSLKNAIWASFLYTFLLLTGCKSNETVFNSKQFLTQKVAFEKKDSLRYEAHLVDGATYGDYEVAKDNDYPGGKNALISKFKQHLKEYPKPLQISLGVSKMGKVYHVHLEGKHSKTLLKKVEEIAFTQLPLFSPATDNLGKSKESICTIVLR